jgi:hypothetical protein
MSNRSLALILTLLGPALATAQGFPEKYSFEPGFDRPGGDYETFEQTGYHQSHELCRDACFSQPKCKSYTFVKPGVAGPKAVCRLKDSEPAPVEDLCCISAVKGGKPKKPAVQSLRLTWLGWDDDKVGNGRNSAPDGAPDHHFVLELTLGMEQDINEVTLRSADEHGTPTNDQYWSSHAKDASMLGVEVEGRRLNTPEAISIGGFAGKVKLDLYAHDIGQRRTHLVAGVSLGNGRQLTQWTELAPPPDRLIGMWQMHCPSSNPNAFEPLHLSGRLQLRLHDDDTISGFFGTLPVTGKRSKDGAIAGTAAKGDELVEWKGELKNLKRGKPLHGSGSFRFVKSKDACVGEGVWSES